jgi:hypothetical protein
MNGSLTVLSHLLVSYLVPRHGRGRVKGKKKVGNLAIEVMQRVKGSPRQPTEA